MKLNLFSEYSMPLKAGLSAVAFAVFGVHAQALATPPKAVNVIKFMNESTLLLGDSQSATVYAYSVSPNKNAKAQGGYNLRDFGEKLAKFAKTNSKNILVRDMAVNPSSQEAYVAFDVKGKNGYHSQVAIVNQTGAIKSFDLAKEKYTKKALADAPTNKTVFWGKTPLRTFTITDLDFHKGKIYVSGMSNAEFSSALRVMDFPFNNAKATTTSVEIFHAVHNQNETRAPIQTMQITSFGGEDYILAAYTCTPLVLIPLKDLKDGAHIVGKTIAEMGYGNTPIDMIQFKSAGFDKKPYEGIILSNRERSAQFINMTDIAKSAEETSISETGFLEKAGTPRVTLPMTGLLQLDDQSPYHIAALRRNADSGELEMVSFLKNVYLRLDDFVSEYDQPGYKYNDQQAGMKGTQNMLIKDLGLDKFVKP